MKALILFAPLVLLAACERDSADVNPPTAPAEPVAPPPTAGGTPASFVGVWSANQAWCSNAEATGDGVPIRISTTRFEGYENSCDILAVREDGGVYDADLSCTAEGETSEEIIRMLVNGDAMDLTYVSRGGGKVILQRCPAEPTAAPAG